jgi:C4-dicarboxylate transporter DctM subunit
MTFLVGLILLLALLGVPLFVVISSIALLGFYSIDINSAAIIVEMYRMTSSSTLIAIPLFTLAGYIMAESNTPLRLVNLSKAFFGWLPGGLAIVTLVACAFFTAFTGASGVTIVALGGILYPILLKEKYPEGFSLGLITSSGGLGLLFPPSLPIIMYGLIAQTSIDKLFVAGIIPGLILITVLSLYSVEKGHTSKVPKEPFSFENAIKSVKEAVWEIPLPFIILIGIYGGYFTASEAAAITAFYILIVEVFIYKDLNLFKDIPRITKESMLLVGGILIVLGTALGLTNFLIDQQIPMKLLAFMKTFVGHKVVFLILLNIFLLIVGCLMDIFSAIIVVVPLIIPIAKDFGIHPIHLGIIFLTNLEIGYSTPPVGINLFISSFRFKEPVLKLYGATLPFVAIRLPILILITYLPILSLKLVEIIWGSY